MEGEDQTADGTADRPADGPADQGTGYKAIDRTVTNQSAETLPPANQ